MGGILLLAAALWALDAQTASGQMRGFIQAGITGSTFRGGALEDVSPIYRLAGGGGIRYQYPNGFEIETGLNYLVKGGEVTGSFEGIDLVGVSEITYVSVPILAGFRFAPVGRFQPRVVAGPSMSFKTDARITYRAVGGDIEQTNVDEGIQDRDLAWVFGLDLNTQVGGESLFAGLRVILGNSNARTREPEVLHTTFGLFTGIQF